MADRADVVRLEANAALEADAHIPKVRAHLEGAMAQRDVPVLRELLVQAFLAGRVDPLLRMSAAAERNSAELERISEKWDRLAVWAQRLQSWSEDLDLAGTVALVLADLEARGASRWW